MNVLEQEKKAVEPDHKIDLTAIETENWDAGMIYPYKLLMY